MPTTTNMGLVLPNIASAAAAAAMGDTRRDAAQCAIALETVDLHDHSPGKGKLLPATALAFSVPVRLDSQAFSGVASKTFTFDGSLYRAVDFLFTVEAVGAGNLQWLPNAVGADGTYQTKNTGALANATVAGWVYAVLGAGTVSGRVTLFPKIGSKRMMIGHVAEYSGGGLAANTQIGGVWADSTTPIVTVDMNFSGGNYGAGTEVIVIGYPTA